MSENSIDEKIKKFLLNYYKYVIEDNFVNRLKLNFLKNKREKEKRLKRSKSFRKSANLKLKKTKTLKKKNKMQKSIKKSKTKLINSENFNIFSFKNTDQIFTNKFDQNFNSLIKNNINRFVKKKLNDSESLYFHSISNSKNTSSKTSLKFIDIKKISNKVIENKKFLSIFNNQKKNKFELISDTDNSKKEVTHKRKLFTIISKDKKSKKNSKKEKLDEEIIITMMNDKNEIITIKSDSDDNDEINLRNSITKGNKILLQESSKNSNSTFYNLKIDKGLSLTLSDSEKIIPKYQKENSIFEKDKMSFTMTESEKIISKNHNENLKNQYKKNTKVSEVTDKLKFKLNEVSLDSITVRENAYSNNLKSGNNFIQKFKSDYKVNKMFLKKNTTTQKFAMTAEIDDDYLKNKRFKNTFPNNLYLEGFF